MWRGLWQIALFVILGLGFPFSTEAQSKQSDTVQAILFYSPTCPHCQIVINETLIPLVESYGGRLEILAFDVTQPMGQQFYQAAIVYFDIPEERIGVPTLVVGDVILVGGAEIPGQFPAIVEQGLQGVGIPWPELPGLKEALAGPQPDDATATESPPTESVEATPLIRPTAQVEPTVDMEPATRHATPVQEPSATAGPAVVAQVETATVIPEAAELGPLVLNSESNEALVFEEDEPEADPPGFIIAGLVLIAMVITFIFISWRTFARLRDEQGGGGNQVISAKSWAIPILAIAGLGVAAYLAYVEFTHVEAICGPIGQCNIVQSSAYAHIWGVPVALLGLVAYIGILLLWLAQRYLGERLGAWPTLGLMAFTILGTLFSIYLTLLEIFVIHAVCAWCLTSAVIMLLLMLLVFIPATAPAARRISAMA